MEINLPTPIHMWITEKAVAKLTGLSLSTLQKHRFYGKGIRFSKIGRSVRYNLEDVEAYMRSRLVPLRE